MRVAIVGTAGEHMEHEEFLWDLGMETLTDLVEQVIDSKNLDHPITLVSGCSPWASHTAVKLFLRSPEKKYRLELYPPFPYDKRTFQFDENYKEARLMNQMHSRQTLMDIYNALSVGSYMRVINGVFQSNRELAMRCDLLLAVTLTPGDLPDNIYAKQSWGACPDHVKRSLLYVQKKE